MNLNDAIRKHAEWKLKFRAAISHCETLDVVTITKDNCCELGKWLHGDARQEWGALTAYAECVARHALFHTEAGKVANAINARRYAEAEAMLEGGTPYAEASGAVGTAILRLKREARL